MVYAVYLNPTMDKTVYIDSLRVGGTNRVGKVLSQGGGKAVNLAVTLHQMDVPVTVCGFLYKGNSRLIRQSLIGISTSLWEFPGEARVNTKIFDQQSGIVTEINESGPALSADILKQFEAVFLPQIKKEDLVVLTGSLPPGCPADYYAQLTEKLPCRVAVSYTHLDVYKRQGSGRGPGEFRPGPGPLGRKTAWKYRRGVPRQ